MDNKLKQITIMEAMGRMKLNQAETDLPQMGEPHSVKQLVTLHWTLTETWNRVVTMILEGWLYMVIEFTSGMLPWGKFKQRAQQDDRDESILENPQINRLAHLRGHSRLRLRVEMLEMVEMEMLDLAKEDNGVMYIDPLDWDLTHCYTGPKYKITA
ncbi:unnamed protein product, partial [Mesorhabditis belari]|uniref:Uncharacterized protein n=1 Tax=Mesorhabditis belari TaxID=2138241 RepID=A0AAF3EM50_9BILA